MVTFLKDGDKGMLFITNGASAAKLPVSDCEKDTAGSIQPEVFKILNRSQYEITEDDEGRRQSQPIPFVRMDVAEEIAIDDSNSKIGATVVKRTTVKSKDLFPDNIMDVFKQARANQGIRFGINVKILKQLIDVCGLKDGSIQLQLPEPDEFGRIEKAIYVRDWESIQPFEAVIMPVRVSES